MDEEVFKIKMNIGSVQLDEAESDAEDVGGEMVRPGTGDGERISWGVGVKVGVGERIRVGVTTDGEIVGVIKFSRIV